jgi:hypothetical protein
MVQQNFSLPDCPAVNVNSLDLYRLESFGVGFNHMPYFCMSPTVPILQKAVYGFNSIRTVRTLWFLVNRTYLYGISTNTFQKRKIWGHFKLLIQSQVICYLLQVL